MIVYRIYDDEWQDIAGEQQMFEFACEQTCELFNTCSDEEIKSKIEFLIGKDFQDKVKEQLRILKEDSASDFINTLTEQLAIEILKLRHFDVEKLNVY